MKKELTKKPKKWKPKKRWVESVIIDLKTGKKKYKYIVPKTPEEEKILEDDFNEKMRQTLEILFPDGF